MRFYLVSAAAVLLSVALCFDCFVRAAPGNSPPPGTFAYSCCGGQGAKNEECCGCVDVQSGYIERADTFDACGAAATVEHWCRTVNTECFYVTNVQMYKNRTGTGCTSTCDTPTALVTANKIIVSCDQFYGGCD